MKNVLITTSTFGEFDKTPLKLIKKEGFSYILNPYKRKMKSEEVVELGEDAVGIIAGTEHLDDGVFRRLRNLKVISRCGAGMESVDMEAAKRKGIIIYNTPDGPTLAVAELAVGLILNLLRKTCEMDRDMRYGVWKKKMGNLLRGKKVGIIGLGRIGESVAKLLSAFGVEIAYHDKAPKKPSLKCEKKGFEKIMKWADIITLHISAGKNSKPLLDKKALGMMKKESWLINLSRGGVVDEKALYKALSAKRITGAAIDVFGGEPYKGALKELDNVILTPHVGSYAREARVAMEIEATKNLLKGLIG